MADRYWVGGTGNWSDTNKWSTSSGGAGGASVPTSADNVIFNAGSDAGGIFTVTVDGAVATPSLCQDFTAGSLDFAMTLDLAADKSLAIYGSMTLPTTNFSVSGNGNAGQTDGFYFLATTTGKTVTTNGVSLGNHPVRFSSATGGWTLGSALTIGTNYYFYVTTGSFDTAGYNITCSGFVNVATATISLGASTITTFAGLSALTIQSTTTLNAGTSSIVCPASNASFIGGDKTFYNVSFTSTAKDNYRVIQGVNTFNNLTFASVGTTGIYYVVLYANQTVNGTLTFGSANTAIRRLSVQSNAPGTPRTITVNGTVAALADVNFQYITAAGTFGTWSGTRLGNGGGNTNITFDAGKDVYRVGTGSWAATQWSLSSGGAVDVNNFPLPQDTAIYDTGTLTGTTTLDSFWDIGTLDMSQLDKAVTFATGNFSPTFYGNITLDADVTLTGTRALYISGAANQTIISVGKTWPQPFNVYKPVGTSFLLGDAVTTSGTFTLTQGTLDLNGFNFTCLTFTSSNSNTRSIAFGTNKIVVTSNGALFSMATATNFTFTGTSLIEFNYAGSVGTRTITMGGTNGTGGITEANALNMAVTAGTDTITTTNNVRNFDFTGFSGNASFMANYYIYGDITLSPTMTVNTVTSNGPTFAASSGIQKIKSNGVTIPRSMTIGLGTTTNTVRLEDSLTTLSTNTITLTSGTLDLNGNDLSTGIFSSSNSNVRSIAFGSNKIIVTGSGTTVWSMGDATSFSYTGTPNVELSYAGSTGSRLITFGNTAASSQTEANALNFNITAGSDTITNTNGSFQSGFKSLNFTGFSGTWNFGTQYFVYGDVTLSPTMTSAVSTRPLRFAATSGTQTLTTNGITLNIDVWSIGTSAVTLADNVTLSASNTFVLTSGTLQINGKTLTCNIFSTNNSNVRSIAMGTNGKIIIVGSGTSFYAEVATGLTTSGTGTIDMTSASAKTFAGGGASYPFTLNQGGTGALSITGANTFGNITNTVQPTTVTFPSGQTTSVVNFQLSGTAGNLVTINASTPGTQAYLRKV